MKFNFEQFEHLNNFLNTAVERHYIYLKKKEGLPKPWTDDPVFQKFFFCNVFRQYDKCSQWIIDNIIPLDRWELIILYRFISTYDTFVELKENCNYTDLYSVQEYLEYKHNKKEKLFSSCFIRNPRVAGGWVKTYQHPFELIKQLSLESSFLFSKSLEAMVNKLKNFPGVGGFMAYEYACDFEYTPWFNPTDKYTWANMGPGAKKGMSYLIHGYAFGKMNSNQWIIYARRLFEILKTTFESKFIGEDITMREVEHWLCEYQKYVKYRHILSNKIRAKHRKYDGGSE